MREKNIKTNNHGCVIKRESQASDDAMAFGDDQLLFSKTFLILLLLFITVLVGRIMGIMSVDVFNDSSIFNVIIKFNHFGGLLNG